MRTNLITEKTLADLEKALQKKDNYLERDVLTFAGKTVSEEELIRDEIKKAQTFRLGERTVELPGVKSNADYIVAAAAKFKHEVHTGDIKPAKIAGHDDVVVQFAREAVFDTMQTTAVNNFEQTGLTAGSTVNIIPQGEGGDSTLDSKEWLFFTGDLIDLNSNAIITAAQWANVDGETNNNPEDFILQERNSDIQSALISAELVKSKVDLDGYASFAGDMEVVPVAFHIAQGKLIKGL